MAVEGADGVFVSGRRVDLERIAEHAQRHPRVKARRRIDQLALRPAPETGVGELLPREAETRVALARRRHVGVGDDRVARDVQTRAQVVEQADQRIRSEEHTSELQSLMRISYAVFCLKKKKKSNTEETII